MSANRTRVALLGVPIDNLTMDEAVNVIDGYIAGGEFNQIATANVDFLIKAIGDEDLMKILRSSSLVLSDGMPLVWASRMMRTPLRERVTGSDLVPRLAELAARKSYSIFLLGATDERAAGAAAWMEKNYPGARIAGRFSPPFASIDEMDNEHILDLIEESAPDILLVAFGNPKQEKWIAKFRHRLRVPVCIGVGASLDFLAGGNKRAPLWMQTTGFEWLHRAYWEPKRLGRRYLSNATGLLRHFSAQLLAMSTQPRTRVDHAVTQQYLTQTSVISVAGQFTGQTVQEFQRVLHKTRAEDCAVILDLYATQSVGADALGALISLNTQLRNEGRQLWLTGMRPSVRRVLRASFLDRHFRSAAQVSDAVRRVELMLEEPIEVRELVDAPGIRKTPSAIHLGAHAVGVESLVSNGDFYHVQDAVASGSHSRGSLFGRRARR
jgi:N-acetylglucosaminyldiphosphoundecaprenol N-acetyl-beta-D-mannosaminyltransferase